MKNYKTGENMTNCSNCKYVRKAGNSNYVACGYISAIKHGLEPVPLISKQNFYGDLVTKEVDFDDKEILKLVNKAIQEGKIIIKENN